MRAIFITGTDTGVGKTVISGCLASFLSRKGYNVITQKWVHTGSNGFPQDIEFHLEMLGRSKEDSKELLPYMVPYSFSLPASPHLAAEVVNEEIKVEKIEESLRYLGERFDFVVIEGVGGLMVPLRKDYILLELVKKLSLPTVVVAKNALGAINHTLLTVEALRRQGIRLLGVVFNNLVEEKQEILKDNPRIVKEFSGVDILGVMSRVNSNEKMLMEFAPIGERIFTKVDTDGKVHTPSSDLIEKDRKYIWHPYTQMKDHEEDPPILVRSANGSKLYDEEGNAYYDTISSWWCNVHGHNHPKIKQAIEQQLETLEHVLFAGFTHEPAILLAEKLCSITPEGLTKVFYSDNGSTSVEVALKMSLQYWQNVGSPQKKEFISLENGYHGDTAGAMSVSGISIYRDKFSPLLFPSHRVSSPYCYRCPMGKERDNCDIDCIKSLEDLLKTKHQTIAGLILEPMVQAAGGMIVYPKEYLKIAAELCRRFGVHLMLDEVATGFGRTGKMFALEHAGVEPDILCLSKGITSGYLPLGATLMKDEIYRAFYADYRDDKTFYHGHTYTANPLSCRAAVASLKIFEEEDTLTRVGELIPIFKKGLERLRDLPYVGDARFIGMIGALELVKDKVKKLPFKFEERLGWRIYKEGLKEGLVLRPLGDVIYLFLPLCIKKAELEEILSRTHTVVAKLSP